MHQLTDHERTLLDVAKGVAHLRPYRAQLVIHDRMGMGPGAFWSELNALIETERALAAEPVLVRRLLERRDRRRAA